MTEYVRPDPDSILSSIKKDEEMNARGKLKIFFGMSAGVGKTYAMLKSAQRLNDEGVDIVAGYVETHKRSETDELVEGLEIIPRSRLEHHGIVIEDLDLDAVLKRRPAVVLVDELAHTNADGMRHRKRYQDVFELLDNGIDVHTTLNVQHVESQADVVEQITGVKIRETLPDSVLDRADSIELIDISPEGLLKRLAEGKVYIPEKAELAAARFFRKGNITALREMALNYVARSVENDLQEYMKRKNIKGPWKAGARLMVAVSPSPYSEYLIRWTRRMAFTMKAPWIALYIEKRRPLDESAKKMLTRNLNLARELGAEVMSTIDEDIVTGLIRVAKQKNINQIVVGKPLKAYISDFFSGGNIVERLLKVSGDIEIHIVNQPEAYAGKFSLFKMFSFAAGVNEYVKVMVTISLLTALNFALVPFVGYWAIGLLFLFYILILGLYAGRGAVFAAAALSALAWNFLFIPPLFTFRIAKIEDMMMFMIYFATAVIVGGLTSRLRLKEWALRVREKKILDMYEFSKALGDAVDADGVAETAIRYTGEYFNSRAALLLADDSGRLSPVQHRSSTFDISESGRGVAEWVFKNRKPAGLFTDTLPEADALYIPLTAAGGVMGVLCVRPESESGFTHDQETFMENISYQLSLRLERERLAVDRRNAILVAESERIYRILLNSISHDLRTPLTTITGASSSLMDDVVVSRPETRNALIREINMAGDRLNRVVDNLLDMSRLESGMMKLNLERYDPGDLVSVVLRSLENELREHKVLIDIAEDLPMIKIDFVLMEQTLINLVYNAVTYTPPGTEIRIDASVRGKNIMISVSDNGPGIDPGDIPFIFDKFRRGAETKTGGTGLGLAICRGIVEAHGGEIIARNRQSGGAEFVITLPVDEFQAEMVNDE